MTWYLSTQIYTMPSVIDLQSETSSNYSSDQFISQNDFVFPQSLDHQDSLSGRYSVSSFPYLPSGSEVPGYCQQQYTTNVPNQHQCYRDNSFVWIGTNNFYPSSSYDQRYLEDSYNPQRQSHRRHNNSERTEKANSRKRRAPTVAQRRAANIRERRRMYNLNEAFDCLRQRIPTFAYEKRLSRIETLRLAISYISFMARIVNGEDPSTLRVNTYESPACSSTLLAQSGPRSSNTISTSFGCDNDDCEEDNVEDEEDEEDDVHGDDDDDDGDGDDDDGVGDSGQDSLLYTNGDSGNNT